MKDKFLTSLANTPPMGLRGCSQTDSRWIAVSPLPNTTTTRQQHDNDTTTSAMNTVRTTARLWKYAACLLLAFFVGVGNMWAEDFTITPINKSYLSPGNLVKLEITGDLKISSTQIQTSAKNKSGTITITTNAPGVYLKSASFTDANSGKISSFTCESGGTMTSSSPYEFTASSNATTATFALSSSNSGSAKLGTISIVVTNGTTNHIETLSGFTKSGDDFSFTAECNGTSVTPSVGLSSSTWTVNSSNISAQSSNDSKTITVSSTKSIKYIAFYDSDCRMGIVEKSSTGGTVSGAAWTAPAEGSIKSVTFKNSISSSMTVTKVFVITESPCDEPSITTQPTGATIEKDATNPTLSVIASNTTSYAWKESSDGENYDGSSILATTASFTPEVNDAEQTKYYYCELVNSCNASNIVKTNIVTVNVVGSITYYTVTLNPDGGTIADATGWTLNGSNYEKSVAEGTELTLPTFTKADRTFKTWRKTGPADVESPVTVTEDLSLTAVWNATIENVIYSWEGAEGGATEVGGTAVTKTTDGSEADDINISTTSKDRNIYYAIKLQGKIASNAWSGNYIQITTTEAVQTGDKIKITACTNKGDATKKGSPWVKAGESATSTSIIEENGTFSDIGLAGNVPELKEYVVPSGINTTTLTMTRKNSNTNCWITKLQITREKEVAEENLCTVTFDAAGGTAVASASVEKNTKATQPADPTWEHHRFDGWYNGATPYDWTANVTGDITLTAHWTQLYTVTYVAGEATATGTAPTQEDKAAGEAFTVADNTFELAGSDFQTWNDGTTDYAPEATYTVGTANVVLTAKWVAAPDKYTVIFMDGADELGRKTFNVGSNPTDDDITKTKPLNTFAAWQKDAADIALDDASWASVAKDVEVTLTARWAKAYATTVDFEEEATTGTVNDEDYAKSVLDAHYYAISTKKGTTFDDNTTTNNGSYLGLKIKNSGTTISWNVQAGKLVLLKAGIMVANGSLSINGGAAATITGGSKTSGDNFKNHYFYDENEAVYVFETSDVQAEIIKAITITDPFTVTFDVAGGDAIADTKGTPSITLPTPTKGTESFLGWFDAADNKIGDAGDTYTPTEDIELVAHWEAVSTDARLSGITFSDMSGELKPAFDPEVTSYTYTMPYGTASIPTITGATAVNANAGTPVIDAQATAWDETARVHGVAQSGDTKNYSVTMKRGAKDGVSIIKATLSGETNKTPTCTVTGLIGGTASVKLSNMKNDGGAKLDNNKSFGITLAEGTFQENDVVNVHITTAASQGTFAVWADDACTSLIADAGVLGVVGDNKLPLPAAVNGISTIYLARVDDYNKWNPQLDVFEVYRPMNPVLTAMTIGGKDVVLDEAAKTGAVTVPNETDLSVAGVAVPTIVWNAPAATDSEVINGGTGWQVGANTYVLTDKDGDATTYTITIDRDALKYAVTFDTDGGNTIEAEEVVADGFLTAAQVPADPTKEDYIFQGWTLDGTPVADLTTVQIDAPKTFVATWAADGAIKLLDGATVNRTNFITDLTAESVIIDEVDYNCVKFSGTVSAVSGIKDKTRLIAYNATTTATKIQLSLYNTSTSARKVQVKGVVEGSTDIIDIAEIELGNKEKLTTAYYDFDNTANRTIYIFIPSSAGDVRFLQVKVRESGAALKMAGESGYSINLNQGRLFGVKSATHEFEGLTFESQSDYQPTSTTALKLRSTSASVTIAAPVTMTVTTGNNKTYYVGNSASSTDNETAFAGESNFNLTAGTWYINAGTSEVQITKLSFSAPKCEEPTITTQPATRLDFGAAGNLMATVAATVADGGTLKYQWYNADDDSEVSGATEATLTTTDEGTYYVIVTNTLADHQDNSIKSDEATLKYRKADDATLSALGYGDPATAITLEDGVYTYRVDLAEGTADVPALTATATMAAYGATVTITDAASFVDYKATSTVLVKAEDGVTTQTYTVNFFVAHAVTALEDVTGNMTWDFSKISGFTGALGATDVVLASVEGMINNGTFESDNLMVNANKMASGKLQASMIKFHTTVDGVIKVKFSDTGASGTRGDRYLVVNGKQTDKKSNNTTVVTYYGFVPAGDVVLTVAGGGNMLNFTSVEFTAKAAPDYTRDDSWMAPGELGTVCYPEGLVVAGANMYQMAGTDENGKFVFDEVSALEPGKPYLFEAQSTAIRFYTTDAAPAASAGTSNGMVGTFTDIVIPQASPNMYYFSGTKFYAVTARTTDLDVPANRAYVDLNDPHPAAAPKPGVRRITFNVEGTNTATGVEEVQGNNVQSTKVLIDGHLYILRGEKTYAPTGQLIK